MKLLIYGLNFSPELTGIGKYTGEMAAWLAEHGHQVHVITAPPYYPEWKIHQEYSAWKFTKKEIDNCTVFRCPLWVPSSPKALTRIIHLLSFTCSSLPVLFKQIFFWRPDAVICIAPSLLCTPQTAILSKLAGVKSWLHFQDFEICAMFGTDMVAGGDKISKIAHQFQGFVTRQFDTVSSISRAMCTSAEQKQISNNKVILFPNWVDIDFITPEISPLDFRDKWDINSATKVILYSGNLGKKQGLETMLDAAQALQHRKDLLFLIVGDGAHKADLLKLSEQKQIQNIQFHPLQPYHLLPKLLRMADIHLILQKQGTADAVLPSKLTSILSAGSHSLITADPDTELGRIVLENPGIATLVPPENPTALIKAIIELCDDPQVGSHQINQVARKYAEKNLAKEGILKQFEQDLLTMLNR